MHELQQILLQKLPRLGELKPGCKIMLDGKEYSYCGKGIWDNNTEYSFLIDESPYLTMTINKFEILGHPFSHSDILEALGEDWMLSSIYRLCEMKFTGAHYFVNNTINLPQNLSDLSLPEYEETRKQLIQLLK